MSSPLIFLLLLALPLAISAGKCRIGTVVNRPFTNQPYSFPTNWNESHSAPHLDADQSCSWVVTIPQGFYVKLVIAGRINDSVGHFQMVDGNGNVVMSQHENKEPYYFPSPKFTLIVNNEAPATLGFKVMWAPYPQTTSVIAGIGGTAHVINITKDVFASEFGSSSGISLLPFPAEQGRNHYTLRSALVFQGFNTNGTYLTNLFNIYNTHQQAIYPSSAAIYVINVEPRGVLDELVVQSAEYTRDLNPYSELLCAPGTTCTRTLKGTSNSKSGLVHVGRGNQTLTAITMDTTATLSIYYGSQWAFFYDSTYNGSTIQSQLPLTFWGSYMTQYIISSGEAKFTFQISN
uniref:CUB_2 domain-containing protein n=1 Tax=Caenorhabditis tropicalis TaxID=1561998 RepID=A0A1I7TUR2_9PELO